MFKTVSFTTDTQLEARGRAGRGSVGAAAELIACADLLKRGWEVFRAVSPHSSADLIIAKDSELKRIEVRTGRISDSGRRYVRTEPNGTGYDILAAVYPDTIIYTPPFD